MSYGRNGPDAKPEIEGNTLRVYIYLYSRRNNSAGVRQVQRALGYSSPSSAIFQLQKLHERGLVRKDVDGLYHLVQPEKVGFLRFFVIIQGVLVPRMLVYALIVSVLTFALLIWLVMFGAPSVVLAALPSVAASIVMWLEARRLWTLRPRYLDSQ